MQARGPRVWITALAALSAPAFACSLIATFDERGGPPPVPDAAPPEEPIAAFPLEHCEPTRAPLADDDCNYRDEACAGFADLPFSYVEKAHAEPLLDSNPTCVRGGLLAYEFAPEGAAPELRVLVREGGGCPKGVEQERLALLRFDARTLAFLAPKTLITVVDDATEQVVPPADLVFARSERRIVGAYRADEDGPKVVLLSLAIDRAPANAAEPPSTWTFRRAGALDIGGGFVVGTITATDASEPGQFFVSVNRPDGNGSVLIDLADDAHGVADPRASILMFNSANLRQATRAYLFPKTSSNAESGAERVGPSAVATWYEKDTDASFTVMSNGVGNAQPMTQLRYLHVPGRGPTTGRARPWFEAAAIVPAQPGPGFGIQSANTRLQIFGYEKNTYAQLRSCATSVYGACTMNAGVNNAIKTLDMTGLPSCEGPVPFVGAAPGDTDGDASTPKMFATCRLGAMEASAGDVVWHRTAGAFGAAIKPDGGLWLVRPGGVTTGAATTIALGSSLDMGTDKLALDGQVSLAFVPELGWTVTAIDAEGRVWVRRFGCPDKP